MRDYRCFYTPIELAKLLIQFIPISNNDKIIDICCGSSNLLRAAFQKNSSIKLYGVDLDLKYADKELKCEYKKQDGREYAIKSFKKGCTFDVVLANPPFELQNDTSKLDYLHSCDEKFKSIRARNLLTEMILANLLLLRDKGFLLLIIPSSIVYGESFLNLRKMIGHNYALRKIWDLPSDIFNGKEVYTNALLIQKISDCGELSCDYESIEYLHGELRARFNNVLSNENLTNGSWLKKDIIRPINLPKIEIVRGNISSNSFHACGTPVLHVSKKNTSGEWVPKKVMFHVEDDKKYNMVNTRDILVARIGRDAGEICEYQGVEDYISDCMLAVKGICYEELKTFLKENYGCENFTFLKKGTTSKYISKQDILNIIN